MKTEHILVVKRNTLFPIKAFQGLQPISEHYLTLIQKEKEFLPRNLMEEDLTYKQIIPYLIFKYEETYFMMQRRSASSEQRLKNKYTLGIGGHMRQEDMQHGATIFDWAQREFDEEISYTGNLSIKPLGILNDDSNAVGQVHLGLVLLLEGDRPHITVRSELKSGTLVSLHDCLTYYPDMESWSQIIFDAVLRPNIPFAPQSPQAQIKY